MSLYPLGVTNMRLYYLTAAQWAEKTIKERRIKISLFNELNDPFELLPHILPSREHRQVAQVLREHLSKERGASGSRRLRTRLKKNEKVQRRRYEAERVRNHTRAWRLHVCIAVGLLIRAGADSSGCANADDRTLEGRGLGVHGYSGGEGC
ncbi:hypothetical protein [Burkholderia multivorans]|uniref:hypothetical protein n=1 Tax=Burkholderia multivorans TaxID=87883 RepID=UPI0021BF0153|nr:hypothetical protein [Burkholderia multivorans]